MTILSWNCRGVAAAATINELRELCKSNQPAILFLMETRAPPGRIDKLRRSLKFHSSFCVNPRGLSGGLCLLWNDSVTVQILQHSPNFIHTAVCYSQGGEIFECTFVYGHPIFQQRRNLWGILAGLQLNKDNPWCSIGDFNEMLVHTDKCGIRPFDLYRAGFFRDFLNNTGLMEIELKGCRFTWASNPRNGVVVREKLDRALGNWAWRCLFPHALVTALPIVSSDHSPLLFLLLPKKTSGSSFKFEAFWDAHPDCHNIIQEGWNQGLNEEEPWNNLQGKIKSCKVALQRWQKREFRRADREIAYLKEELKVMQNQEDQLTKGEDIKRIQEEIKTLWKQEELFWCQRSRIKWLKDGDRNSKFFHATTIQRRGRNRIDRLKDDNGLWVEGQQEVFQLISEHFQKVYTLDNPIIDEERLHCILPKVTDQTNVDLNRLVSDEEIKVAMESMGELKAPGPDGLNGLFFQKNWGTIGVDVSKAIRQFFEYGLLPSEMNETLVTLIPKVPMAESLNQLRPISCCNYIYKIISKIFVIRLRCYMGGMVSQNQSAFVGGRLIQDNLIIAQEAFHALKQNNRGGKENMAIKLDMSKAYDRVEWSFIEKVLKAYGFDAVWVGKIMKLVNTVTYSYKVNGFTSSSIIPQRGLRQGDPLSPFLFILVADALSLMISEAVQKGDLEGFKLAPGAPTLTHLMFADDALLFTKVNQKEVYMMMRILNEYSAMSGQKINVSKSGIIFGKFVDPRTRASLEQILHMQRWENPGKYLGLPMEWGRSKVTGLTWIKERVLAKMEGWKGSLLNQAGKEVLIKAVIQAIPSYAMAMVRFPKTFCASLCSAVARFWWRSNGLERGIHWRNWRALSNSKGNGGLGFRDFTHMNSSLLAKQAWRLIQNPDALWARILQAVYFPNSTFLQATQRRNGSWAWMSLLHGRQVILLSAKWRIGNGDSIDICKDRWLESGDLIVDHPNLPCSKVSDLMDSNNFSWNFPLIKALFRPDFAIKIIQTPLKWSGGPDALWWPLTKSGDFSVKTGYYEAKKAMQQPERDPTASEGINKEVWSGIWNAKIPQKIKHFLWKACHNILPVKENLCKKRISQCSLCPICHKEAETIEHMFFLCEWVRPIWFGLQIQLIPRREDMTSFHSWLSKRFLDFNQNSAGKDLAIISTCCTLWIIWKHRNLACFEDKSVNPIEALFQANCISSEYLGFAESQFHRNAPNPSQIRSNQVWRPPVFDSIKINIDASYCFEIKKGCAGIIGREKKGEVVFGITKFFAASSPLIAEALSMREAAAVAFNFGISKVILESDNLDLVRACRRECKIGSIESVVQDIIQIKSQFQCCGFTWVARGGNQVAHQIAKMKMLGSLPIHWRWYHPVVIQNLISKDKNLLSNATGIG